ncbi:MAG: family 43 glycosylhydrolase [Saccharothrix sp.]|nr:family 43 glycosylhydrolase [Saccharothrix sp.]
MRHCRAGIAACAVVTLLGPGLAALPAAAQSEPGAPLVWYPMDETTGTSLRNAVPGSAFGAATLVNGATPTGAEGVALDGVDDHVDLPDNLLANVRSISVSIDVWIDPAQSSPYFVYGHGVTSTGGYLFTTGDVYRSAVTTTDNRGEQNVSKGSALEHGTWKTLTYTLDDATDTATLYEDGTRVARATGVTITPASIGNGVTTANHIGRSLYAADKHLKGKVRDFRLHDRLLTADELAEAQVRGATRRLTLPNTAHLAADLELPTTVGDGVAVTWRSDRPDVVDDTGRVTLADRPRTAVLTATLGKGGHTATKEFPVNTVDRATAVAALADSFVIAPVVASGTAAPAVPGGMALELAADNPAVGTTGGVLTATDTATARVTARVRDGATTVLTKAFTVTVLPADRTRHVLSYTRAPLADARAYSANLAYSGHLALGTTPTSFQALNENYGVLFPKAVPTGTVDVNAIRTLRDPYLFRQADGTFGVVATRSLAGGADDDSAASSMLYFTSPDLRTFTEVGLVDLGTTDGVNRPQAGYDSASGRVLVRWAGDDGSARYTTFGSLTDPASRGPVRAWLAGLEEPRVTTSPTGAAPVNVIPVDVSTADGLITRFGRIANTAVTVPAQTVPVGGSLSLDGVKADLAYSDGSTARRAVVWNAEDVAAVDTNRPGAYPVRGVVKQPDYPFPFIGSRADPTIKPYRGRYLFIATNENSGAQLLIRSADTIDGLRTAPDHVLVTTDVADIKGCFWAPELHEFAGTLHVFFAPCVGQNSWTRVQAHVLRLKPGGDPTRAADWDPPRPVLQADGTPLRLDAAHPGISLDMTYFEAAGVSYVAWSQRYIVGSLIGDAEIWIAKADPANPYRLAGPPVRMLTAEYGWDHNNAAVAEGPFVVEHDGTLWMTYSGSAVGPTYVTGAAHARVGADLTDPAAWTKLNHPVLKTDTTIDMWGPGHNSFSTDEDGNLLIVFHAKLGAGGTRDVAVRRVHWAADGLPVLDLTRDEEVAPGLREVTATVTVTGTPLRVSAESRCVGSTAYVAVTAANTGAEPVTITLTTPYGSKTVADVAPGHQAYQSFNARTGQVPAGTATATTTRDGRTTTHTAPYQSTRCS